MSQHHVSRLSSNLSVRIEEGQKLRMSNHIPESFNIPRALSREKHNEDHQEANKAPTCSVTFIYEANLADLCCNVTVTWIKNLTNYTLNIAMEDSGLENENRSDESQHNFKIEFKTWQFWGRKGLKSFDVEGRRVDVYWDFRHAKFSNNPEPSSDYYVAMVHGDEVVLVLGDMKRDAYKRTKKKPATVEPALLCKKENVCGKKLFCTKTMLPDSKKEHDITVEISFSGFGDPEMWISIDGFELIHVLNLNWRFRGNERVAVNNVEMEIFWDVHDWLFGTPGTAGHGLFIFKPGALEDKCDSVRDERCFDEVGSTAGEGDLQQERASNPEFYHVIYAWKSE